MGFLRRDFAATELFMLSKTTGLTSIQVVVGLVTITLFVPCVAHFFIMIKERGLKTALLITIFVFGYAITFGGFLNLLLNISIIKNFIG